MRETSLEAYREEIEMRTGTLQTVVLAAIKAIGPCTDLDLEAHLSSMRASTVRGRRAELVKMGLVEECGRGGDGKRHLWRARKFEVQKNLW